MKPIVTQVFAAALVTAPLACQHETTAPQTSETEIHQAQYGSPKERADAIDELDQSTKVLGEIGNDIGKEQRDGAHCVMVVPRMGTGAFIVGGSKGSGVVSCRTQSDWSAPAFVKLSGVTFGLQAGGQASDLVVLANTSDAPGKIFSKNFEFGVGASVAAGPVGAGAQASTSTRADFLSYARTKGAFAGVNLGGVKVKKDDEPMKALYGAGADPILILAGRIAIPADAKPFVDQVRMTFPRGRDSGATRRSTCCYLRPHVDRLILAGDAAELLEKLGVSAYGKRADGRVTIDGWAHEKGKRIAFSYEVDEDVTPEELAERCMTKVREALAQGS